MAALREAEGTKSGTERTGAREARRTQRFILQIPVRYRLMGERIWRDGETENISSSGVLFRSQSLAEAGAYLDLCVVMPPLNRDGAAEVVCQAVVVRSMLAATGNDSPTVAAEILHFRLARR